MTDSVNQVEMQVRNALNDVAEATVPPAGLAERLLEAAEAGAPLVPVASLSARRFRKLMPPLLAAAVVALLAAAVVLSTNVFGDRPVAPGTQLPTAPSVPAPTPSTTATAPVLPPTHSAGPVSSSSVPTHTSSHPSSTSTNVPVPASFTAADVTFVDPENGWAIGDAACANSNGTDCPAVITTRDGGQTWSALQAPTGLVSTHDTSSCGTNGTITGPCVDQVFFADAEHGYLWSIHAFYWTSDGGKTWRHDSTGAVQVAAVGNTALRIVPANGSVCGSTPCESRLEAAPLGSDAWTDVGPAPLGSMSRLQLVGGAVYLFAIDVATPAGGVYRSTDSGAHWHEVASDPCPSQPGPGGRMAGGYRFAVSDAGDIAVQCDSGRVYLATPGAATLSAAGSMPGQDGLVGLTSDKHLVGLAVGTDLRVGVDVSDDRGQSWQRTTTFRGVLDVGFVYDELTLLQSDFGYITGDGGGAVMVSTDGGMHWTRRDF